MKCNQVQSRKAGTFKKFLVASSISLSALVAIVFAKDPNPSTIYLNFKKNISVQYVPWSFTDEQLDSCEISFGDAQYVTLKFNVNQNQQESVILQKYGQRVTKGYVTYDNDKIALPLSEWSIEQLYDMKNYQLMKIHAPNNSLNSEETVTLSFSGLTSGLAQFEQCIQDIQTKN